MSLEKVKEPKKNMDTLILDMSGQGRYRESWSYFYPDVDAIFFVVDSADKDRISIA